MKALYSWCLVAAVGVAALSFLPTPAAADDALRQMLERINECERAEGAYADQFESCVFGRDMWACENLDLAYNYMNYACQGLN